ncbi:hypothetical protein AB0C52_18175 [Streptomyces sp. NPDC048717]|uniref:hypothetical protein n=1 Tax=Streptomyces sp. NPDC048717 TaxID=3154928 RepID=UPI00342659C2
MARHAAPRTSRRSALLKAGLTVTAAGAAVFGAGAAAQAAPADGGMAGVGQTLDTLTGGAGGTGASLAGAGKGLASVTNLQLDPLANTGVDPLDNGLGTQVADFQPVGTQLVTDHLTRGGAIADLPLAGPLTQSLLA